MNTVWKVRLGLVALYVSAWIEIFVSPSLLIASFVALYVSAWIEM